MKLLKYFFQFLFIIFILTIFKIIGLKLSRIVASKIFSIVGPFLDQKKLLKKIFHLHFLILVKNLKKIS